jgi:ABC-type antimicrobial peptide transport system permease subunit
MAAIWIYKRNSLLAASGVFSGGMVVLATDTVIRSTHALFALHLYAQVITILLISSNGIAFVSASLIMINGMHMAGIGRAWEFGMRLVIGARRRDILYQLLCEAFLLSVIGGVSGSMLGLLIGFVLTVLLHLPWIVQPVSLGLLISAAVISGTIGGLYPALKIAQQDFWET